MHLRKLTLMSALVVAAMPGTAQWLDYPTPNVPKTPDGKPDLKAPAPRLNGKPDFSGMWGWDAIQPCGKTCNDNQISTEFINIASKLVAIDGQSVPPAGGRGAGPGAARGGPGAGGRRGSGPGRAGAARGRTGRGSRRRRFWRLVWRRRSTPVHRLGT